jgi:hypothetical protein
VTGRPVLRGFRAAAFAMQFLFVAYFACVQVNAIAYLAGKHGAIIGGAKPPVPIDSVPAAAGDIAIGLIIEAIVALITAIATAAALTSLRDARQFAALRKRKASQAERPGPRDQAGPPPGA